MDLIELHFSADGKILHFLLASFVDEASSTTCKVSLSSFLFRPDVPENAEGEEAEELLRCRPDRQITYKFEDAMHKIPAPFLLSHWTADAVCIALPTLSCCPRMLRFDLAINLEPEEGEGEGEGDLSAPPETLSQPVFFPASTLRRRPRLLVQTRGATKSDDFIFLGLDGEMQTGLDGKEPLAIAPCVMRWKIPRLGGWRRWDTETDERTPGLVNGTNQVAMLRGSFVDSEKRFNVPVRSGLDWTRKGFLSCG
jgi:hypothetical protein